MTIIEPKKNKFKINITTVGLFCLLSIAAYGSILIYNQTVDLKHIIIDSQQRLEELKISNADLKNQFYSLTDSQNLIAVGQDRGLVKVNLPHYIEINDELWSVVSASQF